MRRVERGGSSGRAWPACGGSRSARPARGTGDGVCRLGHGRSGRQRPACLARLLLRHLRVPAGDRRGKSLARAGAFEGVDDRSGGPTLHPAWDVGAGVAGGEAVDWKARLAVLRLRAPLKLAIRQAKADARRPDGTLPADRHDVSASRLLAASPGETVEDWLIRHGQTERIREMLWRPLALAALNQPTDKAGASAFARVLGEMFGS